MRKWVYSLLMVTLLAACTRKFGAEEVVVLKGLQNIPKTQCKELRKDDPGRPCQCEADVSYAKLSGFPGAENLTKKLRNEAVWAARQCGLIAEKDDKDYSDLADNYGYGNGVYRLGSLLQIMTSSGGYYHGAAHPINSTSTFFVDTKTGKKLTNRDIFYEKKFAALNHYIFTHAKDDQSSNSPEYLSGSEMGDWHTPDYNEEYKTTITANKSKGEIYISDNRLHIMIRVSYPSFYYAEIPLEFIRHPEIRKLYKETPDAR